MKQRFVLALFLALFLIASHFSTLITYASSSSIHGCAPLIPPSVPGSPLPVPAIPAKLLINEVLSFPGSRWNCSEPQNTHSITNDSWVELYNPQSQAYNLYAAHATFEIGASSKPFYLPLGSGPSRATTAQRTWSCCVLPSREIGTVNMLPSMRQF